MCDDKRLVWTVEEVADRLGIGLSSAYEIVNSGALRARQISRKWLIPRAALAEYLEGRDNPVRVLTMDEVAEALGIHRDTASKMIHSGTIKALQVGRTWKVSIEGLNDYLSGADNAKKGSVSYEDILEDVMTSDDGWFWITDKHSGFMRRVKQYKDYIYYGVEINDIYDKLSGEALVPVLVVHKNGKFISDGYAQHNNLGIEKLELAIHIAKMKAGSKAFTDDID